MKLRYIGGEGFSRDLEPDELAQYDVPALLRSGNYTRINDDGSEYVEPHTPAPPNPTPAPQTAPTSAPQVIPAPAATPETSRFTVPATPKPVSEAAPPKEV